MADYTTFENISERLGGQLSPAAQSFIEGKITVASRAIDSWCGQSFSPDANATARVFRPYGSTLCRADPFWTTSGLVIKTDSGDDGLYATTWTSGDYDLEPFGGELGQMWSAPYDTIRAVGAYWFPMVTKRLRSVQVTAKWGWAAVPDVVAEACEILTVDLWARKDTPFGITQNVAEFAGLRIGRDVMAGVASLLKDLRRVERTMGIA